MEQQKLRMRVTKIYDPPNDPAWEQQWYLVRLNHNAIINPVFRFDCNSTEIANFKLLK